jgi:hypothetical protein
VSARALAVLALAAAAGCAAGAPPPTSVGPAVLLARPAGGGVRYVGSEACGRCHPRAYARWRASAHARDYAGLVGADRLDPSCLRCHVTGHGDPLGFAGAVPGLAGVGCEACHGAGADHAGSAFPELVPTATGGDCPPCEVNRVCRLCHTPARSPGFELARSLERVRCGDSGR